MHVVCRKCVFFVCSFLRGKFTEIVCVSYTINVSKNIFTKTPTQLHILLLRYELYHFVRYNDECEIVLMQNPMCQKMFRLARSRLCSRAPIVLISLDLHGFGVLLNALTFEFRKDEQIVNK